MLATEQLQVHLEPGERASLSEEARRHHLSVSAYVRNKLLAPPPTEADRILIEGLAALRPRLEAARRAVDSNKEAVVKMRKKAQSKKTEAPDFSCLSRTELASIADNLGFYRHPGQEIK